MKFLDFLNTYGSLMMWLILGLAYIVLLLVRKCKGKKFSMLNLFEEIPKYVANAEEVLGAGKGAAKFDHVLKALRLDAFDNGVKLDIDRATAMIEAVVDATKKVNTNGIAQPIELNQSDKKD